MRKALPALALAGCLAAAGCSAGPAHAGGAAAARHQLAAQGHRGRGPARADNARRSSRVAPASGPRAGAKPPRRPAPRASYYLALGDSLAQGVQPDAAGASVETRAGYADQLYAMLHRGHPGLRLVKLGCPGETTTTMIDGGICRYPGGSQLAAAVRFLHAHAGRVALVTLDIGANDPDSCLTDPALAKLAACVGQSVPAAAANLTMILTRLRAADPSGRMIAMTYYLPALAQWRNGLAGQALARLLELVAQGYNNLLARIYRSFGVRVADVFGAFRTADFTGQVTVPGLGPVPPNVAAICRLTWECAAPPRGPNEHPNQAGYQVIARAFQSADAGGVLG